MSKIVDQMMTITQAEEFRSSCEAAMDGSATLSQAIEAEAVAEGLRSYVAHLSQAARDIKNGRAQMMLVIPEAKRVIVAVALDGKDPAPPRIKYEGDAVIALVDTDFLKVPVVEVVVEPTPVVVKE